MPCVSVICFCSGESTTTVGAAAEHTRCHNRNRLTPFFHLLKPAVQETMTLFPTSDHSCKACNFHFDPIEAPTDHRLFCTHTFSHVARRTTATSIPTTHSTRLKADHFLARELPQEAECTLIVMKTWHWCYLLYR